MAVAPRILLALPLLLACASRVDGRYPEGATADGDRARCEARDKVACRRLGNAHVSGEGVPQDERRARELFKRACELGDVDGCLSLAVDYQDDEGKEGPKRAFALFRSACEGGNGSGCLFLAATYSNPAFYDIVEHDPGRALALYERACALGTADGCTGAGMQYARGQGVRPPDPAKGAEFLQKACDLGDGNACFLLGNQLLLGDGLPVDEARGKALRDRGCKIIGDHPPCVDYR